MDDMKKKPLNARQQRFVDEYLIDLNGTQAAIRAGYSPKTANEQAAQLLAKLSVAQEIQKRIKDRQKRTEITQDRVLQELARIAFFDPRRLFDSNGKPIQISELDDDTAAALAGLDVQEEYEGSGEDRVFIGYTKKYKVSDKNTALTNAMRHLGMLNDKMQLTGETIVTIKDYTGRKKDGE